MHDGAFDHFCAARVDVFHREIALHRRDRGDGLGDAAMVVPAAAEQARLVQMNMRIDEAGQSEPAADVDLGRLAGEAGLDGDDAPAADADVDRGCRGSRPGVAEDEVEGRFRVHGDRAGWNGDEPSGCAPVRQLQIVCSFGAQLFKICACSLMGRLYY